MTLSRAQMIGCFSLMLLLMTATGPIAGAAPKATISEAQRAELLNMIEASRTRLLGLLAGTSDAQWVWKPDPTRWSVGECAEHIVRSNLELFGRAKDALATEANSEWEAKTRGKTDFLLKVMPNRGPLGRGGATATVEIRPTGEMSRQEIVQSLQALFAEVEEFVKTTDAPLRAHTAEHPFPIFNTLNAYQWLLYVPLHTTRHTKQMIEVIETEGFPQQ